MEPRQVRAISEDQKALIGKFACTFRLVKGAINRSDNSAIGTPIKLQKTIRPADIKDVVELGLLFAAQGQF